MMASTDEKVLNGEGLTELVKKIKTADKAIGTRIDALESSSHTHDNKDLLDTYDQTNADITDAVSKRHSHANGDTLDGITDAKVTNWDNAAKDSHSHSNLDLLDTYTQTEINLADAVSKRHSHTTAQTNAMDSGITSSKVTSYDNHLKNTEVHVTAAERTKWDGKQDKLTNTDEEIQDAVTNSHTHANKTVLDGITDAKVTNWDNAAKDSHSHANKAELDTIETGDKAKWDAKQDALSDTQMNAVNSGITEDKVTGYDSHLSNTTVHITAAERTKWNGKQDKLTNTDAEIQGAVSKAHSHTTAQTNAMDSGITSTKVTSYDTHIANTDIHVTADDKATWSGKQDKLTNTDEQIQDAVTKAHAHTNKTVLDGITSAKVTNWDNAASASHIHSNKAEIDKIETGDKAKWDAKQDALTSTQMAAVDSGITEGKVSGYDTHLKDTTVHITAAERTKWNGKQDKLTNTDAEIQDAVTKAHAHTAAQTNAMNSGITSTKVSSYDTHVANSDIHVTADDKTTWSGKQDKLTNTDTEIQDAVNKAHSHTNKTVLDGITSAKVTNWDNAAKASHSHANKGLLDTYTQTEANLADAVAKKHSHTAAQTNAMDSGITSAKVTSYDTALTYIPVQASADNQLADKAYVDAIGERLESRYLAASAQGEPFATHAALTSATAYYYNGNIVTPDTNDVTVVIADEDHTGVTGEPSTTRYRWVGGKEDGSWAFEYVINNSALSQAQLLAVNSGITATKVGNYDSHVADTTIHITSAERTKWNGKQDALAFDGTYNKSTNKVATVSTVTTAIGKLDGSVTGTPGAGKTLTAFSETDGVVTATFGDIAITKSQVTDFPDSLPPTEHTHGYLNNIGVLTNTSTALQSNYVIAIAQGSGTLMKSGIAFDTKTTTTALTPKGTWEEFAKPGDVYSAIEGLDGVITGTPGAGKTLTAFSETDGVVTATFGNISITKSQISDFPTSMTPTSHAHGNITNGGTITADTTVEKDDQLVITDANGSSKVSRASIKFDATTTNKALTPKGTWESFAKAADITTAIQGLDGSITGTPGAGKTLTAFSETDGVVTATFGDISITKSQISDFPTSMTPTSHSHGNITNTGTLQSTGVDVADGDYLVVTDASNSAKVAKTKTMFDGSTTNTALTPKGTFEAFAKAGDITTAIQGLDGSITGTPGAGKTLTAFSETDGVVSATFGDISITKSQVSDFPTSMTPTSHAHGNITNGGAITADTTVEKDDQLVITDASGSSKVSRASIKFDATTTNKALTPKGTWESFAKAGDITTAIQGLDGSITGTPGAGQTLTAFSETDGVVTATFGDISITKSQISDFPTSMTPSSHSHGNITNTGTLQSTGVDVADGDYLVVTDASNSAKVAKTKTKFDGSTTNTALTPKGTFEAFAKAGDITTAIQGLDGSITGTPGAGKTLTAFSETDGVVTATFGNISITKSQVSDFPTSMTPTSHAHGNITNDGKLQTDDIPIASGDKLVVTDSSNSSKVARASISFDGSTTTKALTQKGTWESFAKAGDITTAIQALDGSITGTPGAGKTLTAFSETDGVVTATFGNISITKSQVSDFPTSMTPTSHTHGYLNNNGVLTNSSTTLYSNYVIAIAQGDGTLMKSGIAFDNTTKTKALTPNGTWETFLQSGDIDGKADKVSGATEGDIATLDANGNLVDSGTKPGDYVPVASINLENKTTTILEQVQALQTADKDYARFYTKTAGGSANISDKPTVGTNAEFVLEAYRNRNASASDWRYRLVCWVQADNNPYVAVVNQATTAISWTRLNTNTDTKVTETLVSDNAEYPLLLTPKAQTATTTTTATFDSGVTLNPSTNTITANLSGTATKANYPTGFASGPNTISTWGTLTAANGYTHVTRWAQTGAEIAFAYKASTEAGANNQLSAQVDGWFYQNEGKYRVLDTSDVKSTYSSTGTDPINGTAVAAALGSYLPLAGGAMTGNISFTGATSKTTKEIIRFRDGTDGNGHAITIGGGGSTIISSGEAGSALEPSYAATNESLVLGSDQDIVIKTAVQNGAASAKTSSFNTDGTLTLATSGSVASGNTKAVTGGAVYNAIGGLDATVTSTDGTNVQVKVTETDGKVTAVNITTDNTQSTGNLVTSWSTTTSDTKYPSEKLVKAALDGKQGTITFDGTYNASTNKAATVSTVTNAIGALDVTAKTGTTTQTITSISETDGKISVTYSDIATMGAATASAAGTKGLVPAPGSGKQNSFLRGDGTWVIPTNTDTLVKQSVTTTANYRPIILGYQNDTTHTTLSNDITQQVYATNTMYAQPSTGMIAATSYKIAEKATFQYNSADNAIDLVWSTTHTL